MTVIPHCTNHIYQRTYKNFIKLQGFIRAPVNVLIKKSKKDNPVGVGPFDKDPDDDIPFRGFEEDPEE